MVHFGGTAARGMGFPEDDEMKILIFMTQFYQLGGAELLAVELAEALNKCGIHTDVLSMYNEDILGMREAKERLLERGIPNVRFLNMRIHPPIVTLFPAIVRLRRLIRQHRYDVVETSMISPTVIAAWATRGSRVPHVAGVHHVFRRKEHASPFHSFWRFSVRHNSCVRYYAISEYVRRCWIAYSRTSPTYTRTIYNAVSDQYFSNQADRHNVRAEFGLQNDSRIALYVGRLAAYKGIDTLMDALGPILENENLVLYVVGHVDTSVAGTQEMMQRIYGQVADAGWGCRVRFLGYRKDVPRLMAGADVLVHPARVEGFGLVLAEAMAAGLPVVATGVDGIPEVLAGTESIMVPAEDPEALREAVLKTLRRTPEESRVAIQKGRRRAEAFRMDKRTHAMIQLFDDVLAERF